MLMMLLMTLSGGESALNKGCEVLVEKVVGHVGTSGWTLMA